MIVTKPIDGELESERQAVAICDGCGARGDGTFQVRGADGRWIPDEAVVAAKAGMAVVGAMTLCLLCEQGGAA